MIIRLSDDYHESRVEIENMYIPEQANWAEQQTEQSHYEVELGDLEDSRHG